MMYKSLMNIDILISCEKKYRLLIHNSISISMMSTLSHFIQKHILLVNVEDPVPAGGNHMTGID